jgi:hypothetical protein
MAILKALGKQELKELNCKFIVINVPRFAALDKNKVHVMQIEKFKSIDDATTFVKNNQPLAIFDTTGVYKEKADMKVDKEDVNGYYVRYCKLTPHDVILIKDSKNASTNVNYTFNVDLSCL